MTGSQLSILLKPGRFRIGFCLLSMIAALLIIAASATAQDSSRFSGWIAIPAADYQALRAKAYPVEPGPEPPPVKATLTRISYDLRIEGELAVGQASLTIDVIKDGWVRVPIPSNLLVREAKLDGKPVSLVADSKFSSTKSAVFSRQGRAMLLLDIVLPITATATSESVSLPPAIAGVTRASVQIPRQGVDVKIAGGFLAEKSESAAESKWIAYGRSNEYLTLTWYRKIDDRRDGQPLRLRGSLTEIVGLGEDSTSINAEINAEIVQGAAHEIKLQLPDKVAINQVAGAMVADWEMKAGELTVTFLEPVEKAARFVVTGEARTPREGQIDIPLLRLLNAERETGGVAVEVLGAGEIKDRKSIGLESADATDLGELVSSRQSPSMAAFRFRSGDAKAARSLSVNVARYMQEAVLMANIEEARYQILMSSDGKTLVQASYAVRNNQRNFLKITLPQGAVLWSAALSRKPVRPGQAPDGSLLLPLQKARTGEEAPAFTVEVFYFNRADKWNESGKLKLALPVLDLPISRTGLHYFYPPLYKVTLVPGAFRTQEYQKPISAAFNVSKSEEGGGYGRGVGRGVPSAPAPAAPQATQALVDKYRTQSQEIKRAGILPIKLTFPVFGPSVFLVSELTAENQSPSVEFDYEAVKKGGSR
jgi:hypothetical protein